MKHHLEDLHVKRTEKDGRITVYYIDAEHYLVMKQEARRTIRGNEVDTDTIVGDY